MSATDYQRGYNDGLKANTKVAFAAARQAMKKLMCEVDNTISWTLNGWTKFYEYRLSCGHVIRSTEKEPPSYCDVCGAKVMRQ